MSPRCEDGRPGSHYSLPDRELTAAVLICDWLFGSSLTRGGGPTECRLDFLKAFAHQ
jgi:hypothetical protein